MYILESKKIEEAYRKMYEGVNANGTIDDESRYYRFSRFMAKAIANEVWVPLKRITDLESKQIPYTDGDGYEYKQYHKTGYFKRNRIDGTLQYDDKDISFTLTNCGENYNDIIDAATKVIDAMSIPSEREGELNKQLTDVINKQHAVSVTKSVSADDNKKYLSYRCTLNKDVETTFNFDGHSLHVVAKKGFFNSMAPLDDKNLDAFGSVDAEHAMKRDVSNSEEFRQNLKKPNLPQ